MRFLFSCFCIEWEERGEGHEGKAAAAGGDLFTCVFPASGADRICLLPETDLQWNYSRSSNGLKTVRGKRHEHERRN